MFPRVCSRLSPGRSRCQELISAANPEKPYMIAPAVLIFNLFKELKDGRFKELLQHFMLAKDICFTTHDPLPQFYQFISLFEILFLSVTHGIGLKDAATSDIEWNGEVLL